MTRQEQQDRLEEASRLMDRARQLLDEVYEDLSEADRG